MDVKEFGTVLETHKSSIETRVKELLKENGDKATEAVVTLSAALAEVKATIANVQDQIAKAAAREVPGLKGQEAKKFHFGRAISGIMAQHLASKGKFIGNPWDKAEAGFEKELMDAAMQKRDMIAGDGTLGGYLVPEEVTNEVIDLVIADMPIMDLGPNVIRGLVGDLPIPKLTGRPQGYWLGENAKPTKTGATFGQVFLRPKKAGAFTVQSNRLIYQSRNVSDQIVRRELANALRLTLEAGYISGLGADAQPRGILSRPIATAKEMSGGRFKIDDAAALIQYLDNVDEYKDGAANFGFLMRPTVRGGMKRERIAQFSGQASGAGQPILPMNLLMNNRVLEEQLGHKIRTTTLMSAAEAASGTTSTSTSKVLFGNWGLFRIGMWRDFILRASDVAGDGSTGSALLDDTTYIVCFQETDCMVDREAGFCVAAGAETNEALWS